MRQFFGLGVCAMQNRQIIGVGKPRPVALVAGRATSTSLATRALLYAGFSWVLLDSMITYFSRTILGVFLPVSVFLPLFLFVVLIHSGSRIIAPPAYILIACAVGMVGFLAGFVMQGVIDITKLGAPLLAVCAYVIGFSTLRWVRNSEVFVRLCLVVGGAYVLVCVLALLQVAPSIFPVVGATWSNKGVLELRPEIMTDQNFQVFYFLMLVPLLALPFRLVRFALVAVSILGAVYVLVKLQTRSGVLVMAGALLITWMLPLFTKSLGRGKLLFLPVVAIIGVAIGFDYILRVADLLIARFSDEGAASAAYGRLVSLEYFLGRVWNPLWWFPRGYDDFSKLYGGTIPHSNVAAVFLEGGIFGLYAWVVLFVLPLIKLTGLMWKRQLDDMSSMVLIVGIASLAVQMSLNVPYFKQPWLWAGAVLGAVYRTRSDRAVAAKESATEGAGMKNKVMT